MEATQTVVTRAPLKGRAPFGRHGCPQSPPKANLSFEIAEVFHRKTLQTPAVGGRGRRNSRACSQPGTVPTDSHSSIVYHVGVWTSC